MEKLTGDPDFDELLQECIKTLEIKGGDYSAGPTDRLSNFKEVGKKLGLRPRQVLGVYMEKHLIALGKFCQSGKLESEPITSRIVDVINYCILLGKMVKRDECE